MIEYKLQYSLAIDFIVTANSKNMHSFYPEACLWLIWQGCPQWLRSGMCQECVHMIWSHCGRIVALKLKHDHDHHSSWHVVLHPCSHNSRIVIDIAQNLCVINCQFKPWHPSSWKEIMEHTANKLWSSPWHTYSSIFESSAAIVRRWTKNPSLTKGQMHTWTVKYPNHSHLQPQR